MSTQESMRGLLEKKDKSKGSGASVECLGMNFESDEKRRELNWERKSRTPVRWWTT